MVTTKAVLCLCFYKRDPLRALCFTMGEPTGVIGTPCKVAYIVQLFYVGLPFPPGAPTELIATRI